MFCVLKKYVDVIMYFLILFYEWRKVKYMLVRFYSGWFFIEVLSMKNLFINYSFF